MTAGAMERRGPWLATVCAAAVCAATACQPSNTRPTHDRPIITLASTQHDATDTITERELRAELARLRFEREGRSLNAAPLPPALKTAAIDRMIEQRMLLTEARRLGVAPSTTAVARDFARTAGGYDDRELQRVLIASYQTEADLRATITDRLTVGRLVREQAHAGVTVTDEEISAAWDTLSDAEKARPPRIRALQIAVVTEEEGKLALDELKRGVPFPEVALRHSFAPEAARGGDLGWVDEDGMPSAFAPLFTLEVGKVSPLISTEYGFHIFRVEAKESAHTMTPEEARPLLESRLLRAKLEKAEAAYVATIKQSYKVVKDERALARIE